jgi:hypothetical protein
MTFLTGKHRLLEVLLLSSILLILATVAYLSYNHYSAGLEHSAPNPAISGSEQVLHEMRGLSVDSWAKDRKLLTVKAERFSIEKRKFGFFRFGLMKVVHMTDSRIELYDFFTGSSDNPHPADNVEKPELDQLLVDSLLKQTVPHSSLKGISAIEMKPVSLRIYDQKRVLTRINADSLFIGSRKGSVAFHGNVSVEAPSGVLTTEELVLLPRQALLETHQYFKLKTLEKEFEGYHLVTNLLLNKLPEYSQHKKGKVDRVGTN